MIFAGYNLVGSIAGAVGALALGLPVLFSLSPISGYRLLIWGYVACAIYDDDPVLVSVAVDRNQCHN